MFSSLSSRENLPALASRKLPREPVVQDESSLLCGPAGGMRSERFPGRIYADGQGGVWVPLMQEWMLSSPREVRALAPDAGIHCPPPGRDGEQREYWYWARSFRKLVAEGTVNQSP